MIVGDYVTKIAAQRSFDDQLKVAELDLAYRIAGKGQETVLYLLTHEELERLRVIDIQEGFGEFCEEMIGRRI